MPNTVKNWLRFAKTGETLERAPIQKGNFRPYALNYLGVLRRRRLRRRTPGPPPFSSMNSMPAASKARRTAKLFAVVIAVCPSASSARRIVTKANR